MIYTCHIALACGGGSSAIISCIGTTFSFFMYWFFFKGGMMHRTTTTKEIVRKSFKRLLVPYFVFLIIGFILDGIFRKLGNPDIGILKFIKIEGGTFACNTVLEPTAASWFLLSLFIARITYNALCNKVHPLFITILFACVAFAVHIARVRGLEFDINWSGSNFHCKFPPYYLGNMCHGISVYSLGGYLKEKQFDVKIFAAATALFAIKYFIPAGIDFRMNAPTNSYVLAVLYGMAGCIVINNVFKRWVNIKIPLVSYIGANSMVYYLVHYPVMITMLSLFWGSFAEIEPWLRFVVLSSVVTISLMIADRIFKIKKLRFIIGG